MASDNTTVVSTDIYKINQFIDSIKRKYIDIPEDTLVLGVYGYLSAIFSNFLENTATMASEYSNEAIPTKAKFERNIISHALSLGINKIFAIPASMDILLNLPESKLLNNLIQDPDITSRANYTGGAPKDTFIIDKDFTFTIGEDEEYQYHLDYDIKVKRNKLPNGSYVYSAIYETGGWINNMVKLNNPYLPAIGIVNVSGDNMLSIKTTLRQYTHSQIYKKITVDNPLETKILNFSFEDQLVFFYVDVVEQDAATDTTKTHHLLPVYDGLHNTITETSEYINFIFLDETNIRLKFNRDVYQPTQNAEVTIHVITTLGDTCNFSLSNNYYKVGPFISSRYTYNDMYYMLQAVTGSENGQDKLSVEQLKTIIPQEALSRGSISTYTDLNNAFNAIQTPDIKMTFLRKVHNQIERLYYAYLLLRDSNGNIIPTNTITSHFTRNVFSSSSKYNFILKPGAPFYMDPDTGEISCLVSDQKEEDIKKMDKTSFLYMNPYLMIINKSPFYVSFYMTIINYTRELYFKYINDNSLLQFVTLNYNFRRTLHPDTSDEFEDENTYTLTMNIMQNISSDYDLIVYKDDGTIDQCLVDIYAVLYRENTDGSEYAYKYCKADLYNYDEGTNTYTFKFHMKTNDSFAQLGSYIYMTEGLKNIGTGTDTETYVPSNCKVKFFILAKFDKEYGRTYTIDNSLYNVDDLIPNLTGYSLTNIYECGEEGLDTFYDYTDINNSFIELAKNSKTGENEYTVYKIPVIRYTYLNSDSKWRTLMNMIDRRRRYIQNVLVLLEDSFGIDYKFYNTYGKSLMYNIDNKTNIDRINLSLRFEIKFVAESEKVILSNITASIKDYIEDMNNITDLHMPNLITYITNLYRDHIVYIKFIGINSYDDLWQSIYKNPKMTDNYFVETQTVPEFINVNTTNEGLADIQYTIVN